MEFFSIRDFRNSTKEAWTALDRDGKIVITNNSKPKAIMLGVDNANFDDTLLYLKCAELSCVIKKLQQQSIDNGTSNLSWEEINVEITAARNNV